MDAPLSGALICIKGGKISPRWSMPALDKPCRQKVRCYFDCRFSIEIKMRQRRSRT